MSFNVEQHGFAVVSDIVDASTRHELISTTGPCCGAGLRGLLALPAVASLASSPALLQLIRPHLAAKPFPVRAIFFDKSPDANWFVTWHQGLTIAVRDRADIPGYGQWSIKEGVPHVQPPAEILEQMLAVRIHLDAADENNGALRVLPGSHTAGCLSESQIVDVRDRVAEVTCVVEAGGAMLMRPLLLHASGRSLNGLHRRVLHIEYAGCELPPELVWKEGTRSADLLLP